MRVAFLVVWTASLSGAQIVETTYEQLSTMAQVRCSFAGDVSVWYNPGFIAPVDVPRFFKKKYFFCSGCTISSELLKKMNTYKSADWAFFCKRITVPAVGILMVCAYNPATISFSWLRNGIGAAYVFYFTNTELTQAPVIHDDRLYRYAFYKDLPKIVPMC